jgi:signal transduction histidine kinase
VNGHWFACYPLESMKAKDLAGSELMGNKDTIEDAICNERVRIAEELDIVLQTFLSASMQLGVAADSLPCDSAVKARLDRILRVMDEGVKQGLDTIQSCRSTHPLKSAPRILAKAGLEL